MENNNLQQNGGGLVYYDESILRVLFMVQFYLLPSTPRAYSRGFTIFFLLGGLFPSPGHEERDNSPPPELLIDLKYVVLCTKYR